MAQLVTRRSQWTLKLVWYIAISSLTIAAVTLLWGDIGRGRSGGGGRSGWWATAGRPACPACPCQRSGQGLPPPNMLPRSGELQGGLAHSQRPQTAAPAPQHHRRAGAQHPAAAGSVEDKAGAARPPDPALLCGGPWRVPHPDESVAAATRAMRLGPEQDLARWAKTGFTRADLEATARRLGAHNGRSELHFWVEVDDGMLVFPRRPIRDSCLEKDGCNQLVDVLVQGLNRGVRVGKLVLPEGLPMIWNVHDWGICWDVGDAVGCPAPVFSVQRHDIKHYDVLMPNFRTPLWPQYVPWVEKQEQAWFRGTPYCNVHPINASDARPAPCSRHLLPNVSREHPHLLNITITEDVPEVGAKGTEMRWLTYLEQAHYKYLVDLMGISASNRLAALLGINSVVLKQESLEVEWYYRALRPCTHYLPFWVHNTTDILQLVGALRDHQGAPANDEVARRLAASGQAFALAHLTEEARWRYWQALLDRYASLYKGGDPSDPPSNARKMLPHNCYGCHPENEEMVTKYAGDDPWDPPLPQGDDPGGGRRRRGQRRRGRALQRAAGVGASRTAAAARGADAHAVAADAVGNNSRSSGGGGGGAGGGSGAPGGSGAAFAGRSGSGSGSSGRQGSRSGGGRSGVQGMSAGGDGPDGGGRR